MQEYESGRDLPDVLSDIRTGAEDSAHNRAIEDYFKALSSPLFPVHERTLAEALERPPSAWRAGAVIAGFVLLLAVFLLLDQFALPYYSPALSSNHLASLWPAVFVSLLLAAIFLYIPTALMKFERDVRRLLPDSALIQKIVEGPQAFIELWHSVSPPLRSVFMGQQPRNAGQCARLLMQNLDWLIMPGLPRLRVEWLWLLLAVLSFAWFLYYGIAMILGAGQFGGYSVLPAVIAPAFFLLYFAGHLRTHIARRYLLPYLRGYLEGRAG